MFFPSPENTLGTYYLLAKEGYGKVCYCQMHSTISLEKEKEIKVSIFNQD